MADVNTHETLSSSNNAIPPVDMSDLQREGSQNSPTSSSSDSQTSPHNGSLSPKPRRDSFKKEKSRTNSLKSNQSTASRPFPGIPLKNVVDDKNSSDDIQHLVEPHMEAGKSPGRQPQLSPSDSSRKRTNSLTNILRSVGLRLSSSSDKKEKDKEKDKDEQRSSNSKLKDSAEKEKPEKRNKEKRDSKEKMAEKPENKSKNKAAEKKLVDSEDSVSTYEEPYPESVVLDERGNPTCYDDLPANVRNALVSAEVDEDLLKNPENLGTIINICRFLRISRKRLNYTVDRTNSDSFLAYNEEEEANLLKTDIIFKTFKISNKQLGKGSFGVVYKARSDEKTLGVDTVAIKRMQHTKQDDKKANLNELRFLSRLQHDNIVEYVCSYLYKGELWMILENMLGGTLNQAVVRYKDFTEAHIAFVAKSILKALRYMHEKKIMHRDLKSENIMMTTDGRVKLIDFGLCDEFSTGYRANMVGSPYWMSPEMIQLKPHGPATDIWSFAISLLELANGHAPNQDTNALKAMVHTACLGCPEPLNKPAKWSDTFKDFLSKCLQFDPANRPSAAELLKHEFVDKACPTLAMAEIVTQIFVQTALEDTGLFL